MYSGIGSIVIIKLLIGLNCYFGVSSNGRTAVSGTVNRGSSPCTPATHIIDLSNKTM